MGGFLKGYTKKDGTKVKAHDIHRAAILVSYGDMNCTKKA
jgi:hypothetical protein